MEMDKLVSGANRSRYQGGWQFNRTSINSEKEDRAEMMDANTRRRMLEKPSESMQTPTSIVQSSKSYSDQLRESRESAKNTSNAVKQLKYSFKGIASQLSSSKTANSARQVAAKARREVVRLKMKLQSGEYNSDELEVAIEHAKSMERAAKKKARHLEEEELVKITDGEGGNTCVSDLEDALESREEAQYEAEEELSELTERQVMEIEESMKEAMEEVREIMESSMEEMMDDMENMSDMLMDSMSEMMAESLSNLSDSMMIMTDYEMSEDEFKEFKLKHRIAEDKEIMEADMKYLKGMFEIYNKSMGGGGDAGVLPSQIVSAVTPDISVSTGDIIPNVVDVSV